MPVNKPPLPRDVRLLIGMCAARSIGQGAMVAAFTLYLHALGWSGTAIGTALQLAYLILYAGFFTHTDAAQVRDP